MQKGSELCDDPGTPLLLFAVVAANYQPSMPRPPRESWAADARRTPEQRQRPLLSAVFGNISASYDGILIVTTISNPKLFVNLTHRLRIYLDRHYPRHCRWFLNHPYDLLH
jgi:hypothetical protein